MTDNEKALEALELLTSSLAYGASLEQIIAYNKIRAALAEADGLRERLADAETALKITTSVIEENTRLHAELAELKHGISCRADNADNIKFLDNLERKLKIKEVIPETRSLIQQVEDREYTPPAKIEDAEVREALEAASASFEGYRYTSQEADRYMCALRAASAVQEFTIEELIDELPYNVKLNFHTVVEQIMKAHPNGLKIVKEKSWAAR